jgi:hypothetical protein
MTILVTGGTGREGHADGTSPATLASSRRCRPSTRPSEKAHCKARPDFGSADIST